jgi:hypothetical protein
LTNKSLFLLFSNPSLTFVSEDERSKQIQRGSRIPASADSKKAKFVAGARPAFSIANYGEAKGYVSSHDCYPDVSPQVVELVSRQGVLRRGRSMLDSGKDVAKP